MLSLAARNELDQRLARYARATGHQVLVYIDQTTDGVPIEDWAVKAFERWRVGRQGIDDGLVLFIFAADRKLRIEIGYALEPIMTDAMASRIIRDVVVPRIQSGDRDGAVRAGVDAILTTLGTAPGEAPASPAPARSSMSAKDKQTLWIVGVGFLAIPVLLGLLFAIIAIHPGLAARLLTTSIGSGRGRRESNRESDRDSRSDAGSSSSHDDDGSDDFSGGGGRSGGGGASGSW
jgi:uncharacterized protein